MKEYRATMIQLDSFLMVGTYIVMYYKLVYSGTSLIRTDALRQIRTFWTYIYPTHEMRMPHLSHSVEVLCNYYILTKHPK